MLAKLTVEPNKWFKYKSETPIEPGTYFWFMGHPPKGPKGETLKKKLGLIAAQCGREFRWLAPFEPWVKRFVDGMFDPLPPLTLKPDWGLIGIDPSLPRSWQRELVREAWNYLGRKMQYRKGWIAPLGAGKTLGGLLISQLYEANETAVLASRYLHETWRSQAEEWGFNPPLISTYESVHKLPESVKCLIIDESVSTKNPDAQRTKRIVELSGRCETVIGFTGIPTAGGGPPDWRWLRAVNPGCVPADMKAWQFAWGLDTQLKEVGPNKAYITEQWDHAAISAFISPYVHTVDLAEIAAEMPEITYNFITCPQPTDYSSIQAGAGTTSGTHKRLAQCLQATDGFIYNDDDQPVRFMSPKLHAIKEWVETLNEPVILVGAWTETVNQLAEMFTDHWPAVVSGATADPGREIERFKSGHTHLMIVNAGYSKGMNLQKVCRVIGFCSVSSKPDDLQQMIGRVARPGQRDGVTINFFCCENSLDRRRIELVQKHRDCSDTFIDRLLEEELCKHLGSAEKIGN